MLTREAARTWVLTTIAHSPIARSRKGKDGDALAHYATLRPASTCSGVRGVAE